MIRFAAVLMAVGAVVYFAHAYLPLWVSYCRVRLAAERLAREDAVSDSAPSLARFVAAVRRDAGVELDPQDVHVRRYGDAVSQVQLRFKVPLSFPLLGAGRSVYLAIATGPQGED